MAGFRRFLCNPELFGPTAHLDPNAVGIDAGAMPQRDEVVEQIGTFADDAARMMLDRFERDLAGLLDHFLRRLAGARCEESRRAPTDHRAAVKRRAVVKGEALFR